MSNGLDNWQQRYEASEQKKKQWHKVEFYSNAPTDNILKAIYTIGSASEIAIFEVKS